ncbi:MAG: hypothetical protein IPJ19_08445 [Planctomycetes bacterium]|nr:hypothetical protein [Planctomycetota bacterium]
MMKRTTATLLLGVALAAFPGCSSPSRSLRGLAQDQHDDVMRAPRDSEDAKSIEARSVARAEKVRKLLTDQQECSAADHYNAALVLVQCTREEDLELAHEQALAAAEHGEPRGFRVAAEALDKLMVKRGMLQKYGTQFVWEPVLRAWQLYPVDPGTSDEERQVMGVPPLAEIQKQEAELNRRQKNGSGAH